MNKIRIISVLTILSFLVFPFFSFAQDAPVLSMAVNGTITLEGGNMSVGTILKAYCGNTTTEIGSTTLAVAGQYGPQNTSLPVNNCAAGNYIYVQAFWGSQMTEKKQTDFTFTAAEMRTYNIAFTSSSVIPTTPTAPSSLSAVVDSQTAITLSWSDNSSNETGFAVYKNGVKITTTAANVVSYQATGLTAGTSYNFYVKAVNVDQYSAATSTVTPTTLAEPVNADSTTGTVASSDGDVLVSTTEADNVNDSTSEVVVKAVKADAIANITIVGNIQTLSSIIGSSTNILIAKQSLNLGKASSAGTADANFNTNAVSTVGVPETTVFVPVDTTTTAGKRLALVIPKLSLIKTSAGANLANVEIRPPVVKNSAITETAITACFAEPTAPVAIKAAVTIPTTVSGILFKTADGTTSKYIDICMDKSGFTVTDATDILVYDSADNTTWAIDSAVLNKAFVGNQFCFQTNHLSSFAGGQAQTKTVSCTQSGAPSNASYTEANVTVTWTGSAWSTPANCAWTCNTNYNQSGNTCVFIGSAAVGGGGAGEAPAAAVPMPTTTTGYVTATVAGGGKTTITTTENTKATVKLPAYAVSASTNVSVVPIAKSEAAVSAAVSAVPSGKSLVGNNVYNITASTTAGASVTTFSKYVTITLTYTDSQIVGLKESSLKINYWDETTGKWNALTTTVDKAANTLTAQTLHFTYFSIIGEQGIEEVVDRAALIASIKAQMKEIIRQLIVLITQLIAQLRSQL